MIFIKVSKTGEITASGLIPGQVVYLESEEGWAVRITRLGRKHIIQEVKNAKGKVG